MTNALTPVRSEKGVALVIVLLLLAVMSALTTGLAMSSQTEIAMASNEMYYASARAAAEAGLNRAIEQITANNSQNLLAGADNAVDPANPAAAVNADNGRIPVIGNGPFTLSPQYTYTLQILDDDDPSLYASALSGAQLAQMSEDGNAVTSGNDRLILRAIGLGPRGTRVILQRILQSVATPNLTTTTTTTLANPALLVDGQLELGGSLDVWGSRGNIHANGNITGQVSGNITGDITATGTVDDRLDPEGMSAGNMPSITVPEVKAADYRGLADWILAADGSIRLASDNTACGGPVSCPSGWTYSGGVWSSSGSMPDSATYYVEGAVTMHGTGTSPLTAISVIAEGNITITGNGKFKPENTSKIQFVTNGDFRSNADANDPIDVDGQIMVREQIQLQGGFEFQGRIVVKNKDGATNVYDPSTHPDGRRGADEQLTNDVNGNISIQYNGSLGDIVSEITTTTVLPTTYTNNVSGWIEQ